MTIHNVKIEYQYAVDVLTEVKSFEIRKNDRDYKVGDLLYFTPINVPDLDPYCVMFKMENSLFKILYITNYAQQDDYVVMSIKRIDITQKR